MVALGGFVALEISMQKLDSLAKANGLLWTQVETAVGCQVRYRRPQSHAPGHYFFLCALSISLHQCACLLCGHAHASKLVMCEKMPCPVSFGILCCASVKLKNGDPV